VTYNPVLVQAVARARIDELQRTGAASAHRREARREQRGTETIRRRAGWLLVGMGLRLVFANGAAPRGQHRSRPA